MQFVKKNKSRSYKYSDHKESFTIDNKYKQMALSIIQDKKELANILIEIDDIKNSLNEINNIVNTPDIINTKLKLINRKDELDLKYNNIVNKEIDYYNIAGDLIIDYYDSKYNKSDNDIKETKNIKDFLTPSNFQNTKNILLEKYCHCINGIRINQDDGSNRIKYCYECDIEKILDISESSYICPCCGHSEMIIIDEDRQIKEYSPYKRLNHFKEWLNQFQAKQTPDIPEHVFVDIINELNRTRITDLSKLNKSKIKLILKKLGHNIYYEHIAYIINKLNNLPTPKITKDMEKIFISMFYKIQVPWELHKQVNRKNFLSYSFVLHKLCELLDLNHLLDCFSLHKDVEKIIENDKIWQKICNHLNWTFISSFK